jgi:hypothetical protein
MTLVKKRLVVYGNGRSITNLADFYVVIDNCKYNIFLRGMSVTIHRIINSVSTKLISEAFALLQHYAAYVGICSTTHQGSLFLPSSRLKQFQKMEGLN